MFQVTSVSVAYRETEWGSVLASFNLLLWNIIYNFHLKCSLMLSWPNMRRVERSFTVLGDLMKNYTVSGLRKAMIWMVYAFEWVSCISALSLVGGWVVCLQCIWNGVQWEHSRWHLRNVKLDGWIWKRRVSEWHLLTWLMFSSDLKTMFKW